LQQKSSKTESATGLQFCGLLVSWRGNELQVNNNSFNF
jgi:hypothetical protein